MNTVYAPPPAPAEITPGLRWAILGELTRGRLGACCMCKGIIGLWYSPAPPSGYVPLHEGCVSRLLNYWQGDNEDAEPEPEPLRPRRGRGIYGRVRSTVERPGDEQHIEPVRPSARGATLPGGFTPGPYWQPGDDAHTPWTVLAETIAGHTICPCGPNRAHGEKVLRTYEISGRTGDGTETVGAALIGPDGAVADSWGSVPVPGKPLFEPIFRLSAWSYCTGCHELRWPGSWMTVHGARCVPCERAQTDGERPWPVDPAHPGEGYIPEHFTKVKRVTLPASAKRPVRVLRSRRKSG